MGWLACSDIRARPGTSHCHNRDVGNGRDKPREGCIVVYAPPHGSTVGVSVSGMAKAVMRLQPSWRVIHVEL